MDLNLTLEDLRRASSLCMRCLVCTYGDWPENYALCPIYERHRVYTASPGGLIYLVRALADKQAGYTPTMAEFAYQCTLCGACEMCEIIPIPPPHVGPTDIIRFLRHRLVKDGQVPQEVKALYHKVERDGDYVGTKPDLKIPEKVKDVNADTVLFVEGVHSKGEEKMYQSAVRLLEMMGTPVAVFELDGGSCGAELYDLGFWDELRALLKTRIKAMGRLDGKEILFINPHCQEFMMRRYPEIVPEGPEIRGRHFTELLVDAFEQGRLKPKKQKIKASYHDPCHLARGLRIHEAPRKVLSVLGVQLMEMKRNREDTYCCGAGGKNRVFSDFRDWVAAQRIKEFKETGAELLITACPYCKEAFERVLSPKERSRVQDLFELVQEQTA